MVAPVIVEEPPTTTTSSTDESESLVAVATLSSGIISTDNDDAGTTSADSTSLTTTTPSQDGGGASATSASVTSSLLRRVASTRPRRRSKDTTTTTDAADFDNVENEVTSTLLMSSHERQKKKLIRKSTEGMTINKLQLSSLGLIGRDTEMELLEQCFHRVSNSSGSGVNSSDGDGGKSEGDDGGSKDNNHNKETTTTTSSSSSSKRIGSASSSSNRELVLISGPSGSGKSVLATTLRQKVGKKKKNKKKMKNNCRQGGPSFVVGKFDYSHRDEPYTGITAFCREICGKLILLAMEEEDNKEEQTTDDKNGNNDHVVVGSRRRTTAHVVLRNKLIEELGNDLLSMLIAAVPELEDFIGSNVYSGGGGRGGCGTATTITSMNQQKLNHAFRLFIRTVCSNQQFQPLVILLDDLQWADTTSLDVMEAILTDQENKNGLLVMGCYRSDEIDDECHILSKYIRDVKEKNSGYSSVVPDVTKINKKDDGIVCQKSEQQHQQEQPQQQKSRDGSRGGGGGNLLLHDVTEIEIGNLSLEQVNQVIVKLLSLGDNHHCGDDDDEEDRRKDRRRTMALATLCHKRTQGNPFYLMSFLKLLESEEYLTFNLGTLQWTWDVTRIEQDTASTENVVDMMMQKMNQKINQDLGQILQIASLLGSRFDIKILFLVWNELHDNRSGHRLDDDDDDRHHDDVVDIDISDHFDREPKVDVRNPFVKLLKLAVEQSFVESVGGSTYQWVHDKVQEAAFSLIPESQQLSFKFDVGMTLLRSLDDQQLDSLLFVLVNLLDSKECDDDSLNEEIARLSARAANKARDLSAFSSAAKCAAIGIKHMPDHKDKWNTNYDLALELHCIAAESESVLGGSTESKAHVYANEVLENGRNILDKVPVYYVMALALGKMGKFVDAGKLCIDAMNQLRPRTIPRNGMVWLLRRYLAYCLPRIYW